ncbi:transcription factor adf-1 [Plakobranchus ocellatus]|uniref:Transcription factor adf-1 n=1 Tax=Plakobranchus ocellatus TaxID=259542 RepID=A0AAV4CX81_9GAST|nr:transcription factor adf-1 [Plakobranchus ocellatus]
MRNNTVQHDFVDDEKLIAAVKKRPLLYDIDHPQHCNRTSMLNAWKEIAVEIGHEVHSVKERWVSMRDYYRKKLRELGRIKAGQLNKKFKKWSQFDKLNFLRPHLRHIGLDSTQENNDSSSKNDSDVQNDSEEEGIHIRIVKTENTDDEDDDIHSDDSYRRDIVQALDPAFSSSEVTAKSSQPPNTSRQIDTLIQQDNPSFGNNPIGVTVKRPGSSRSPPPAKRVKPSPMAVEETQGGINTNMHFFTSLIPMIETMDSIAAMEFRHEVHGILLRYLKEARNKETVQASQVSMVNNVVANDVSVNEGKGEN